MDLKECLSILRTRGACPGHHQDQTTAAAPPAKFDAQAQQQREPENLQIMLDSLSNLSTREIALAFMAAQEDRCATYKQFEAGFRLLLTTASTTKKELLNGINADALIPGLEHYPSMCGSVTATFAALSRTVRAMSTMLRRRSACSRAAGELADIIDAVQRQEKAKLELTAALHLERMRKLDLRGGESNQDRAAACELVDQEALVLQRKIANLECGISDALEEMRYCLDGAE
jgi:hypothetical protein